MSRVSQWNSPSTPHRPLWDAVLKVCVDEGFSLSMLIGAGAFCVCVGGGGGAEGLGGGLSCVGAYCLAVCMIYTSELLCDLHPLTQPTCMQPSLPDLLGDGGGGGGGGGGG